MVYQDLHVGQLSACSGPIQCGSALVGIFEVNSVRVFLELGREVFRGKVQNNLVDRLIVLVLDPIIVKSFSNARQSFELLIIAF